MTHLQWYFLVDLWILQMSWTFHRLQFPKFGKATARLVLSLAHWSTEEEILVVYLWRSWTHWSSEKTETIYNSCRSNGLFVWLWRFTLWNIYFSSSGVQRTLSKTDYPAVRYPRKIHNSKYGLYSTVCRLVMPRIPSHAEIFWWMWCETSLKQYSKVWSCMQRLQKG